MRWGTVFGSNRKRCVLRHFCPVVLPGCAGPCRSHPPPHPCVLAKQRGANAAASREGVCARGGLVAARGSLRAPFRGWGGGSSPPPPPPVGAEFLKAPKAQKKNFWSLGRPGGHSEGLP